MEPIPISEKTTPPTSPSVGGLEGIHAHGNPPYEHVEFLCRDVRSHSRHYDTLRCRLLWHHDRPGLLLFHPGHPLPPPLHHWQSHGEEAGETYMSLFPSDDFGRHFFFAAPTADLLLVHHLTSKLAAAFSSLVSSADSSHSHWAPRLSAFRADLDAIPWRLHYDDIACHKGPDSFLFHIVNVLSRNTFYPEMQFEWGVSRARIIFPRESEPTSRQRILDLGGHPQSHHEGGLQSFSASERAIFHDMLGEVPNFLDHIEEQHNIGSSERMELTQRAKRLRHELGKSNDVTP